MTISEQASIRQFPPFNLAGLIAGGVGGPLYWLWLGLRLRKMASLAKTLKGMHHADGGEVDDAKMSQAKDSLSRLRLRRESELALRMRIVSVLFLGLQHFALCLALCLGVLLSRLLLFLLRFSRIPRLGWRCRAGGRQS